MATVRIYTYRPELEGFPAPPLTHPAYDSNGTVRLRSTRARRNYPTQQHVRRIFSRGAQAWHALLPPPPPSDYIPHMTTWNRRQPFTIKLSRVGSAAYISPG